MTQKDFAFIALRIFAVYILIQSFIDLSHIVNYYLIPIYYEELQELVQTNVINMLLHLGPFLVQLVMSIVVWLYADKLSRLFIPEYKDVGNQEEPNQNQMSLSVHQFQVAAVSIVGLAFIVHTLPSFFSLVQNWLNIKEVGVGYVDPRMKGELLFSFLEKLLRLVLGFVLFFGSRGLVGLLKRIRSFT
ncbi:hypothetical protein [Alkalihalobacillus sp. AL-G]|uniref:hypothetical protein n=1 Tax=Alkalihalobacillus sp. AL-G TaxID=2926399 RepID=UPI002729FB9C|nr:hypothetical protein [Alkalihalobacillus sp. AL-G]WLD94432.1 hypothetical protein MOJ78_05960 [Alkalihalobacillus sp. AL-G]